MKHILLVDDQPHVVRVIKLALERQGYATECASNGLEALEKLSARAFDVVITDMEMPKMGGQALCEAMRRDIPGPKPLTLVVTGLTDPKVREWVAELDNTELFEKPLSLQRLKRRLARHFVAAAG